MNNFLTDHIIKSICVLVGMKDNENKDTLSHSYVIYNVIICIAEKCINDGCTSTSTQYSDYES